MYNKFKTIWLCLFLIIPIWFVSAQTVPPAPSNLTVEQMMGNAMLRWDASQNASGYRIYKAIDTLPFSPIGLVKMNSYADQFVPEGHIYRYYVTAYNYVGESEPSNDVIFIPNSQSTNRSRGVIAGNIVDDSTGLPICGVRVRFFTPNGFMYFREARTDTFGYYSIHIDSGSYLVYATKWTYIPEWYDNVLKPQDATPVLVTPHDTSIANFGLTRIVPPPQRFVTISGKVTDSTTGNPISQAYVLVLRTNRLVNIMQNQEGSMFGNRNETFYLPEFGTLIGVVRVARTDSDGNYSVKVPDSLRYIMLAFKKGYIPEFYKDKRTPFDADRLFIVSDTSGIDFDLVPNPLVQNTLSGTVVNEYNDGVMAKVVLYHITPFGVYPARWTITDTLGNYTFNYLYKGYYFVKAVPLAFYAPAWYDKEDSCGARWFQADFLYVDSVVTGINICVKPINLGGFASINGIVRESESGIGVGGATVFAVSLSTEVIIGYDITEDDGSYDIQNLAPGSYKIIVDKEERRAIETPYVTVDASNNYTSNAEINVVSEPLNVQSEEFTSPKYFSLEQNYPNPFNPSTEISFSLPTASKVNISVYNVLGQLVATLLNDELAVGNYSVKWNGIGNDGNTVGTGVYFYKMTAKSLDHTNTFSTVKKMLMVK